MTLKNRQVKYGPFADKDLQKIYAYTADTWGKRQARLYLTKLKAGLDEAAQVPGLWKIYQWKSFTVHYLRIERHYPVFIVEDDTLYVLKLFGDRMDLHNRIDEFLDTHEQ